MSRVLSLLLLLRITPLSGQVVEHYFSEHDLNEGGKVSRSIVMGSRIIVGGRSLGLVEDMPSVTMLDANGEELWNTASFDTLSFSDYDSWPGVNGLLDGGDGAVYATVKSGTSERSLWKLDTTDGSLLWRRPYLTDAITTAGVLENVDAQRVLLGHGGYAGHPTLELIDRSTGTSLQTYVMNQSTGVFSAALDHQGHIYYSTRDTIFKDNVDQLGTHLWWQKITGPAMQWFTKMYVDSNDSLFVFGDQSGIGHIHTIALRTNDGSILWRDDMQATTTYQQHIDHGGRIYLIPIHTLVPGGSFVARCLDKATGDLIWYTSQQIPEQGVAQSYSGGSQGVMAADVDANGDLYLTGYNGSANYDPGCWVIAKMSGVDGQLLYDRRITLFPTIYDFSSCGYGAHVIDGQPCFVGDLETYHPGYYGHRQATYVRIDGSTGEVQSQKPFNCLWQPTSATHALCNTTAGTYVLKQRGTAAVLELYDTDNNLLWERSYHGSYALKPHRTASNSVGDAWFTAYSTPSNIAPPYVNDNADSLLLFHVSANGVLLHRVGFAASNATDRPTDLVVDAQDRSFMGYERGGALYLRRFTGTMLDAEVSLNLDHAVTDQPAEMMLDASASSLLIAGFRDFRFILKGYDKNTQAVTALDTVWLPGALQLPQQVVRAGAHQVLFVGQFVNQGIAALYDIDAQDTLWSFKTTQARLPMRLAWSPSGAYVSMGKGNGTSVLFKLDPTNGDTLWTHVVDGPDEGPSHVLALAYDPFREEVTLAGYERSTNDPDTTMNVLIQRVDADGTLLDEVHRTGTYPLTQSASCALALQNGALWAGGARDTSGFGHAGFLYELLEPLNTSAALIRPMGTTVQAYPQPASTAVTILLPTPDALRYVLSDAQGRIHRQGVARQRMQLTRGGLSPGVYILTFSDGNAQNFVCRVGFE